MKRQSGFTVVEVVLMVAALTLAGYLGYTAYQRHQQKAAPVVIKVAPPPAPAAPQISTTSDLDKASTALDQTNIDASLTDSSQLNSQLSSF